MFTTAAFEYELTVASPNKDDVNRARPFSTTTRSEIYAQHNPITALLKP